jgi:5-methylcytosine-specific restriction endonuclease McrA
MIVKARRRVFGRGYNSTRGKRQGPTPYSHYWTLVRKEALLRDGYVCQLQLPGCLGRATEADHIVSVADGGEHTLENARAVCKKCHRTRTAQHGGAASKRAAERRKK